MEVEDGRKGTIHVGVGVSVSFVFGCHLSACGVIVVGLHLLSSG